MAEILVVGLSARALAQTARRAGYVPLAADFFRDLDTRAASARCAEVKGDLERGFEAEPLLATLGRLAEGRTPIGIVCGTGFEDRPELLGQLGNRWPLIGNCAAAVERVKNPRQLATLCEQLGIPHPRLADTPVAENWLRKRIGGSGGGHVARDCSAREGAAGYYWQHGVEGDPVSALVLGTGPMAVVLDFSDQWCDPTEDAPYRYGGAVRPAALSDEVREELEAAAGALAEAAGLVGLNSVDFLVGPDSWHLIEVNPRPGTTLDLFASGGANLIDLHMQACGGRLPVLLPTFTAAAAARLVYARRRVTCVAQYAWPEWTADRQAPGTSVETGAPVCTVLAKAATAAEARRLVEERGEMVLAALGAA
jgi:predicted ATP-grasp superfamily ATP-dependent carboligase